MKSKSKSSLSPGSAKRLGAAIEHQRSGQLDDAERIYKGLLAAHPKHPDILHNLGVLTHQRGDHAKSMNLIERAIRLSPNAAAMHSNLAEVHRAAGHLDDAEASCRRAIDLNPAYAEPRLILSLVLAQRKDFIGSEVAARAGLELTPSLDRGQLALADALRGQGRMAEAEAAYLRLLSLWPDHAAAMANLGLMLVETGRMDDGLAYCRRAALLEGDDHALLHFARAQFEFGLVDEAENTLAQALERTPNAPEVSLLIGRIWAERGDRVEARHWFGRVLQLDPGAAEPQIEIADLESDIENHPAALEILDAVLAADPANIHALVTRAKVRLSLGDVNDAVADHRESIRLRPELASLHSALGNTLSTAGDIEGAVASLRHAIALNPQSAVAYSGLLTTLRHKVDDAEQAAARALLDAPWMTDRRKSALNFGLAAFCDGAARWEEAAERMAAANAQRQRSDEARDRRYDPAAYERFVDEMIDTFTPELFARLQGLGSTSERPVFIVGMPRSGTTLTEQIIASHPDAFGAGERSFAGRGLLRLPLIVDRPDLSPLDCLQVVERSHMAAAAAWHLDHLAGLDATATRVVDKMPDNYHQLGWLAVLFPKARFINCRRDMRDVALSCWITNFSEIRWANDLSHLAHRIEQHVRLVAHWRRVLPVQLLDVDYERMVEDQEGQSRRLVDWIGLEWSDRCLDFHKTRRLVRTASVSQVRQPIYRGSLQRWRHYPDIGERFNVES